MSATPYLVSVVDDDLSVRESLQDLLRAFCHRVETFASAEEFLASEAATLSDCLILDIGMPGMTGPELQREMASRRLHTPIVFITALKDETLRLQLIKRGAVDCLYKPLGAAGLQLALGSALKKRSQ
ncbi:response regulator transcription factor [Rhizobium leucaenae]|uniref:FixJ family two-component response regulator n=1 Tax=Rhizobium leucaenae TaxID=29450 RepID=A0A7W6ZZ25_9HYPH|nr:response regulator [Rhizobium leucaenae]MBB4571401.1 FixJ family two-component response regulator [Rhizobium leucaenae]MBB6305527.1 FixJ family two-component response regulator [Rhizobium leucaenae]